VVVLLEALLSDALPPKLALTRSLAFLLPVRRVLRIAIRFL